MHLDPTPNRPAQRDSIREQLEQLVTGWQDDIPPNQVLAVLADAEARLRLRIEQGGPIIRSSRGRRG